MPALRATAATQPDLGAKIVAVASLAGVAALVSAIARLSRYAAIPNIAVIRPGPQLWRA
jgi:enterochelin esterase-like enzyme